MRHLCDRCIALAIENCPHRCAFAVDERSADQLPTPVDDNVMVRNPDIVAQVQRMVHLNFIRNIVIPHSPYTQLLFDGCMAVRLLAWSPNSQFIATKSYHEACVRIWDVYTRRQVGQLLSEYDRTGTNNICASFAWSPNSKFIAVGLRNGTVQIWHVENMANIHLEEDSIVMPELPHVGRPNINSIAWSPSGSFLAVGSTDETVRIWDTATKRQVGNALEGQRLTIGLVAWSPNPGSSLLAVSANGTDGFLSIWDARSGCLVRKLDAHLEHDSAFAWSPDGRAIATISEGTKIVIWDANTGTIIKGPLEHRFKLVSVSWSPDLAFIAAGSVNEEAYIWKVDSGKLLRKLNCGVCAIVSWSPLYDCFVIGSTEELKFWLPRWHGIINQSSDLLKQLLMLKFAQREFLDENELRTLKPLCDQLPPTAREWAHEQMAQAWATRAKNLLNTD